MFAVYRLDFALKLENNEAKFLVAISIAKILEIIFSRSVSEVFQNTISNDNEVLDAWS